MKKYILGILVIMLGLAQIARADVVANNKIGFYYLFHLYYDSSKLVADRDFKFVYDIIPGEFTQDNITTQFPYRGEIINFTGEVAAHFVFDPQGGDVKFTKGKLSVKAPYIADAQKVVFYDNQNQPILTVPVSDSSYCNDDGICNANRGEDSLSCPKDCKQTLPAPPANSATSDTTGSSGLVSSIIYILLGLIVAGLVWWLLKRHNTTINLTSVPPQMPTPPASPTSGNNL